MPQPPNVNADEFTGSFDTTSGDNLFKATFGGSFGDISLGVGVMPAMMSADDVVADLTAQGSLEGGGALGPVDLIYVAIPEPSTMALLVFGLIGLTACLRRR